ncbi:hypothetical protein BY458DRAFT_527373 [Sporodiniella umbellata]|nr:hypothetical protein BY458DRAFT_527373 [Sporodiniella umbellata]
MEDIYQNNLYSTNENSSHHPPPYAFSPRHHAHPQQPSSSSSHAASSEAYSSFRSFSESPRTYYPHYPAEDHNESHTTSPLGWSNQGSNTLSWNSSSLPPPAPTHIGYHNYNASFNPTTPQRPKLTTTVWEDEGTICYQVDAKSVCVARRQDNDMINGTKLLNVVGMSRGKRDGILKNEKGRVVVKVGAMHLKGVWITFNRAKDLATKFKIFDILYPLFVENPSIFLTMPPPAAGHSASHSNASNLPYMLPSKGYYKNEYPTSQPWGKQPSLPSLNQELSIRTQPTTQTNLSAPLLGSEANQGNSTSENELYMIHSPCEFRLNRASGPPPPPYSTYPFEQQQLSYRPKPRVERGEEEGNKQISFPSSPPPDMKFGEFSSASSSATDMNKFGTASSSSSSTSHLPLLEDPDKDISFQKGRKRMLDMTHLQNKRIKDKDFIQTP